MAQARNNTVILSSVATGGAIGQDCTHVSLWDASTGGNLLHQASLTNNPNALAAGDRYEIAINALSISQTPATGETEEMAKRGVTGKVAGGVWAQFHSAAPGNAGTANVIPVLGRTQIAEAEFTVT